MDKFFILIFSGVAGFLFLIIVFLTYQVFALKRRLGRFLRNGDKDLEELLSSQVEKVEQQQKQVDNIKERVHNLEDTSKITFQKVGLVRFNPFKQTGSDQSFSVALLNAEDDGFVITSLYGREENRVYAKPIEEGESNYSLTEEEQEALNQAQHD
ncbi:MAG: DUF4446 family protein [Candidatus Paceibacterota bacterium]